MKIRGIVKKNMGRGTKLGFPTANLDVPEGVEDGIYAALVRSSSLPISHEAGGEKKKLALAFIGAAETFGDSERKLEVHILDFDKDLYGQEIEVQILQKLRDKIKFNSQEELVDQMKQDEKVAREFFETYGRTE